MPKSESTFPADEEELPADYSPVNDLNPSQRLWALEYLVDLNIVQSARRVGYSAHRDTLTRMFGRPKMQAAVRYLMRRRERHVEVKAEQVVEELAKIAFMDITDFVEWDEHKITVRGSDTIKRLHSEALAGISQIQETQYGVRIKVYDKLRALEMLGRHFGLFVDRKELAIEVKNLSSAIDKAFMDRPTEIIDVEILEDNLDNLPAIPKETVDAAGESE